MRTNLKVALVSHEFPPSIVGGIGTHCYDLACSLSAKGIETKVLCGTNSKRGQRIKINSSLEVIRLPYLDFPPRYFWFQLQNCKKLRDLTSDCNIIHGVNPTASFGLALNNGHSKKALITTHHLNELLLLKMSMYMPPSEMSVGDLLTNVLSYPLDDCMERLWFRKADRIIVPGTSTFEFMQHVFPCRITRKISVVPNGINFEKIAAFSLDSQDDVEPELSVVCFSRLVSLKGIAQFLSCSKPLFSDFPSLRLKIFGKGPLYPTLVKLLRRNSLSKNVALMGHVTYSDLIRQVSKATVAVFPTFLEIGPFISALEAMACKRPVIAFDFSFNREFIKHMETGILALPGDMNDLVDKTKLLLSDESLRAKIGENAQKYVRENHNWHTLANKYIEIYEKTLSR